jgi:uncharacterized OsmC-like protein
VTEILVRHIDGDAFTVSIRGHECVVDQPVDDGGLDRGPTPTELYVASLGACVGFYAERYLARHGFRVEGLEVDTRFAFAQDRPARVSEISMTLHVPAGFPRERLEVLQKVVDHCTVHNSIVQAPEITTTISVASAAA